jgi:hypothetical protein
MCIQFLSMSSSHGSVSSSLHEIYRNHPLPFAPFLPHALLKLPLHIQFFILGFIVLHVVIIVLVVWYYLTKKQKPVFNKKLN